MKSDSDYFQILNKHRLNETGPLYSDETYGNNGVFVLPLPGHPRSRAVTIISDQGPGSSGGWEHVSVRVEQKRNKKWKSRTPTWDEMCWVKNFFWSDDECVVQYHPPKSEYVNMHPHVLHLWKPLDAEIPKPPKWMVGL